VEVMVVTGMSGAGKTEALKCLEDMGYFAIDNLPASLLGNLVELAPTSEVKSDRIAAVMDIRGGLSFFELFDSLDALERQGVSYHILFMTAADEVLVRRFSETRRIHPLQSEGLGVADTITEERVLLRSVRERADLEIDTTSLNVHQLRDRLYSLLPSEAWESGMRLALVSFGYKYGHPLDADMLLDTRFLPNPYWVKSMRKKKGTETEVVDYVLKQVGAEVFLEKALDMLLFMLPGFANEKRAYLTVGIGCTGGRHRSVVISNELASRLREKGVDVTVLHRDVDK
jgi:RNase adapter protein RapZ